MALEQADLDQITAIIQSAQADTDDRIQAAVTRAINTEKFGGPTVQVAPSDLVYLGTGKYVSESTGHVYEKASGGRLVDLGIIPDPA